ncbi:restriction endonuclease subunit S [Undibacterium sp. SXout20W]|uniref:restriction endonuclease subunit S n=1 Tax=Undibacterium sp. SXout20W TaxID=3413051 RepID=UPI003BF2FAC3
MSRYKAYPEYKDSEVEWLGQIPIQWKLTRVKYISELTPKKPIIERSLECSFIPMEKLKTDSIMLDESRVVGDVYDGYTYFQDDDILMAKVTPCFENKNIAVAKNLANGIGFGSSEIYVIRTKRDVCNRYWFYRFQEDSFMDVATAAMTGAGGLKRVPSDVITNFTAALPSFLEQQKIASFLDHETAKIDTLIAKQQELIKLLKEKRQAVISHAVTKGLNPNAPMRDSGVEWLGEVPAHWVVAGFKKYLNNIVDYRGKTPEKCDSGVFLVTARNIKNGKINYEASQEYIAERDYEIVMSRGKPRIGEILFTTEAPLGEVASVDREDIALAQRIIKFDGHAGVLSNDYLKYLIMSDQFQQSLFMFASGSTALGIKVERLVYLRALVPPMSEQLNIVNHIQTTSNRLDNLIQRAVDAIDVIKERRTALISAAVTGKIDVRDWQPPVSEAQAA